MATTTYSSKAKVSNPLSMFNVVGQELEAIFTANGISRDDAEAKTGIKGLFKKESLKDKQIDKVCEVLGMGDELRSYLNTFQEEYLRKKVACDASYHQSKMNYAKLKGAIPMLKDEFQNGRDVLDDILDFFGVDSEQDVFVSSEEAEALYRKQNNVPVDAINLKAWLRRGELDFQKMELPDYDETKLKEWINSKIWEKHVQDSEYFKGLPLQLSSCGVALVLVPFLPRTVYGAVRWIDNRPLVQISDRTQDLATCWFTLFHELGHVILHKNSDIFEGQINDCNGKLNTKQESEANKFANQYLFNGDELRKEVFACKRKGVALNAAQLSSKYDVNSIFSSYWLRKVQNKPALNPKISIRFC
jgi:Zn-dependent peptidase ImmA (M78 family)